MKLSGILLGRIWEGSILCINKDRPPYFSKCSGRASQSLCSIWRTFVFRQAVRAHRKSTVVYMTFTLKLFKPADGTKAISSTLPAADQDHTAPMQTSTCNKESCPPANQQTVVISSQRASADMCGSLHLTGSPSSCVSHRPAWWGLMGADCGDFQHYGHYHGFGDTAEELTDSSRLDYKSSIQAEQKYNQAVASSIHLYHGS